MFFRKTQKNDSLKKAFPYLYLISSNDALKIPKVHFILNTTFLSFDVSKVILIKTNKYHCVYFTDLFVPYKYYVIKIKNNIMNIDGMINI